MNWQKKGIIIGPRQEFSWMTHGAGPSFARVLNDNELEIYVSGRNKVNQSQIGVVRYNPTENIILSIAEQPLFSLGELGTFDYNGTSYPWLVEAGSEILLYYTGWTIGYHVAFINDLGLYHLYDNFVRKHSRAPLIPRTDFEPYGVGSVCVIRESDNHWKMWYTCFQRWGSEAEPEKHFYHIKYAESSDGIVWNRPDIVSVDFDEKAGEYVTGKPSVIKRNGKSVMWYSYRGDRYKIGIAISDDGKVFKRFDSEVGISGGDEGFDDQMIGYGHVFLMGDTLHMIYNGNGYGRTGLALATMPVSELDEFIENYS